MPKPLIFAFALSIQANLVCVAGVPTEVPLWGQAIKKVQASRSLVASKVTTHLDVYDGKDSFQGSLETVHALSGWKQDKPLRKSISEVAKGSPGFTMTLNLGIEDKPGEALDGYDTWVSKGLSRLGAKPVTLFEAAGMSGSAPSKALVYVDPDSALPLRVDYTLPIHSNFGTRIVNATVLFGATKNGAWVPQTAIIDQSGKFMFWSRHLIIKKTYEDWAPRPDAAPKQN